MGEDYRFWGLTGGVRLGFWLYRRDLLLQPSDRTAARRQNGLQSHGVLGRSRSAANSESEEGQKESRRPKDQKARRRSNL